MGKCPARSWGEREAWLSLVSSEAQALVCL